MTSLYIRVDDKKMEKIEKYLNLVRELKKLSNMNVTMVLLVVGALDTSTQALGKRLKIISLETKITELQKSVLIHTSRILQKVPEVWGESCWHHTSKKKHIYCRKSTSDHSKIIIITKGWWNRGSQEIKRVMK